MNIQAVATDSGLYILKNHVKEKIKQFVMIGFAESDNSELDSIVNDYNSSYGSVENYIIYKSTISSAYYDTNGALTFELNLPYEPDFQQYIYGIGLLSIDNELVSISKTPKIFKMTGIGGTFVYKLAIRGEPTQIIFNEMKSFFASDEEATNGEVRHKAIDPYQLKNSTVTAATKLHTPCKINGVEFDGSKDITIVAEADGGHSNTVTKLKTPRKINGVEFDGSKDIVAAAPLRLIATITSSCRWHHPNPGSDVTIMICGSSGGGGGGGGASSRGTCGAYGGDGGMGQLIYVPLADVSTLDIVIGAGGMGGGGGRGGGGKGEGGAGGGAGGNTTITIDNSGYMLIHGGAGGGGGGGWSHGSVWGAGGGSHIAGMGGAGGQTGQGGQGQNYTSGCFAGGTGGAYGCDGWGSAGSPGKSAVVYIYAR